MGSADDARLPRLDDERAIQRVFLRYFDRVDANDPAGAGVCFTNDAVVEVMTGRTYEGREAYVAVLGRILRHFASTTHQVTNVEIDVEGDAADVRMYVVARHRMRESGEPWTLWGRIHERLRRTQDGWLIAEHRLIGVDAEPMREGVGPEMFGGHPGRHVLEGPRS